MQFLDIPFDQTQDNAILKSSISSSTPIIDDLSNKEVVVMKFIASMSSFPIFIPELSMNLANKRETVYSFILAYSSDNNNLSNQSDITHVILNQENQEELWKDQDNKRQPINKMCFINSYSNIAFMLNSAIQNALGNLLTKIVLASTPCVYLYFDSLKEKIVFRLNNNSLFSVTNPYTSIPKISIYFSKNMTFMFSGLPYIDDGKIAGYNRLVLEPNLNGVMLDNNGLLIYGIPYNNNSLFPPANAIYEVECDFSIASNFTSVKNILITTSLGIESEQVQAYSNQTSSIITKQILPDGKGGYSIVDIYQQSTKTFSQLILLDLSFDNSVAMGSSQSIISYNNNIIDVSRRCKILQNGPLYALNINVLYVDCFNNIRDFELNSRTQIASLKLAFI